MPAELCTLFIKPLRFCYQNIRPILPSLTKSTKYGRNFFYSKNPHLKFVFLCRNQVTWKIRNLTLKSREQEMGFAIMFKCMSGFITDNGKYIMPLQEKLSYYNSVDRCNSFGFKTILITRSLKQLLKQHKFLQSLKKTWITDLSCRRRKWTEVR